MRNFVYVITLWFTGDSRDLNKQIDMTRNTLICKIITCTSRTDLSSVLRRKINCISRGNTNVFQKCAPCGAKCQKLFDFKSVCPPKNFPRFFTPPNSSRNKIEVSKCEKVSCHIFRSTLILQILSNLKR